MPRRILFVIRSKLGDTLISYAAVRAYIDAHPQDQVTLLTRRNYAQLLEGEAGLRVIGFDSRIAMLCKLFWLRFTAPAFDVLGILFGSGAPIAAIGRWVRARRKIAWNKKSAPEIFEQGELPADPTYVEPAMSVIHAFAPDVPMPMRMAIPSLAARYAAAAGGRSDVIGVAPLSDEVRRNFDGPALLILLARLRQQDAAAKIRVFVNPDDDAARELMRTALPENCEWYGFTDLRDLVDQYMHLRAWYGTDTGLFHMATSIGVPATVFFGPTQTYKSVLPGEPAVTKVRLAVLGESHCEQKTCTRPRCLHQAIADYCATPGPTPLEETPMDCPLRGFDLAAQERVRVGAAA
ncbi:MAG TPA: glycosyltransferase family 9 protein [Burkholderiales bacterium]|jgi:ADP-heptose:LPS heptosyltransferase|nr:glycosyltransferase family 9 protein [Burkholderiales bacterium]